MPTTVCVLRRGDEAVLKRVAQGVFDDPMNADSTRLFLEDPRHHLAVAVDGGVVVGFASAVHYIHPDKAFPALWVNEVGIAPTHREQGLATGLLKALFEVARQLQCSEAWVLTERTNTAAMRLYASTGGIEAPSDPVMFTFRFPGPANEQGQ